MASTLGLTQLRTMATLGRSLGPWADAHGVPLDVHREEVPIRSRRAGERGFSAFLYRSRRNQKPHSSLLLVPGLHYLGPLDPRMDRFARILASAGMFVLAPRLPDFASLVLGQGVFGDVERAFELLYAHPARPKGLPGLFSISFGSLPALWLAGPSSLATKVGSTIIFGGYADFEDTLRFCLHGRPNAPHDPLNRPVVFMNLMPFIEDKPKDLDLLFSALRRYVEATWGKSEMKVDGCWQAVANGIAAELPEEILPLFFASTGVSGDTSGIAERALANAGNAFSWLDPKPFLGQIRCPVDLIHGADDDVIPYEHANRLANEMRPGVCRGVHITGLYGHTHQANAQTTLGDAPALAKEAMTLMRMLAALSRCGS